MSNGRFESDRPGLSAQAAAYGIDALQRSILFMDVLRRRGNIYLEHQKMGSPPVLSFDYEIIMDGRTLEKNPVNYALAHIPHGDSPPPRPEARPIVIIDPRAGHGPGIGGSKRDSEVGFALKNGNPVYFVLFFTHPMPGQTLAHVKDAEALFIQAVSKRHPGAPDPAVIGNCQAGWAVALLGAERPDITGPLVLNGAPLSYWSGVKGRNPMRYRGGIFGGAWITSLLGDLGNGRFDGANLVYGFEDLNPSNTYWTKQYNVWAKVDTEADRYLDFEKWWNGYFLMNAEEIHFIVDNLFVGNRLERGELELNRGRRINLRNLEDPVVVFASSGDNITPPQQALNWIMRAFASADDIRENGQVIVYRVHEDIGHLGIFVSGKVARKEHREIIRSMDLIDYVSPGLYELMILPGETREGVTDYQVRFEERTFADLARYDDGTADEAAFAPVAAVSQINDSLYRLFVQPWVRLITTEFTAEMSRQLHPLRMSRYGFSDMNPLMAPVKYAAPFVEQHRRPAAPDNVFVQAQDAFSRSNQILLDWYRDVRDSSYEYMFYAIYEQPWMKWLAPDKQPDAADKQPDAADKEPDAADKEPDALGKEPNALGKVPDTPDKEPSAANKQMASDGPGPSDASRESATPAATPAERHAWLDRMETGGFPEAVARMLVAMAGADQALDRDELALYEAIRTENSRLRHLPAAEFKKIVRTQARILQTDRDRALDSVVRLLANKTQRREALSLVRKMAYADRKLEESEKALLERMKQLLGL